MLSPAAIYFYVSRYFKKLCLRGLVTTEIPVYLFHRGPWLKVLRAEKRSEEKCREVREDQGSSCRGAPSCQCAASLRRSTAASRVLAAGKREVRAHTKLKREPLRPGSQMHAYVRVRTRRCGQSKETFAGIITARDGINKQELSIQERDNMFRRKQ